MIGCVMADHTPGPWTAHKRNEGGWAVHADGQVVALLKDVHDDEKRAANAILIAAAPDMLEMLAYVADREMLDEDDLLALKHVIAKATGD